MNTATEEIETPVVSGEERVNGVTPSTKPASNEKQVVIDRLGKVYPTPDGGKAVIVADFNLKLAKGEFASIIGHSGCGKTTVLNMVAGLNPKSFGTIEIDGTEVAGPGPDRGVVFQAPCLLPWFDMLGNVMLGVDRVYPHASRKERKQLAEYYLSLVGLEGSFHKYPKELSRGMQQRVGIARALALQPKMLLLDEPFGMLDSLTRMELQDVLLGLLEGLSITTMMVTHDVDEALYLSDRVIMMTNGPAARVGRVLEVPFTRPRDRDSVLGDDSYYDLREDLISFLEEQDHRKHTPEMKQDGQDTSTYEALNATQVKINAIQDKDEASSRKTDITQAAGILGDINVER
ncbi:ABC transporter ATP-binding protein [Calycomorphotria hydatis]|uniref:Bicarbonate transport ATP-binding protein CmpD n=1 Tax=Calycomorphotria hydatis TaxID=2528027 RepID=A0A517T9Z7_9PLAN|nr:ABC transporter ATP-binding protein [Calycomorphotria hydatis]QDT65198.1 Bicarbonate transport ATP-binding protein CmpD [Calycomorphotria hydatis]